jgi:hypothetical protein
MQTQSNFIVINRLDKAGILCSGACAIHCLLFPVIAFASPTISSFLNNEWIHLGLLTALIPIALIAFIRSKRIHKKTNPILFGVLGIVTLVSAVLLEALHIEVANLEKILTGLGSVILILGHVLNIIALRETSKDKI